MNKTLLSLAVAGLLAASGAASAAVRQVAVFGDRFPLGTIDSFYDSLANTNSTIIGSLTAGNLAGVQLLWAVQPAAAYTGAQLTVLKNYMDGGGRIAFMGEHGSYAPQEDVRIAAAVTALGGNIGINLDAPDGGFHDATVGNGQILANSLTAGVNTYNYACFASLVLGGTAEALMVGTDHNQIMMAYQAVGAGSIFLITDQNVWDNVNLATNDNKRMFENLLSATVPGVIPPPVVVPGVPEPETYAMLLAGLGVLGFVARRRRA